MKREQQALSKNLSAIEHEIAVRSSSFEEIKDNLESALTIIENCGKTYRYANDGIKRLIVQSVFERIWITDEDGTRFELTNPFRGILGPIENLIIHNRVGGGD